MSQENLSKFGKYFVAYGEFHDNLYNKLIHIVCIPTLYYTMMYLYRNFLQLAFKGCYLEINFSLLLTTFVTIQGMSKSWVCQSLTLLWESIMYFHQRHLTFKSEREGWEDKLFYWMLVIHVIAWILQIAGHAIFESKLKRKSSSFCNQYGCKSQCSIFCNSRNIIILWLEKIRV